MKWNFIVITLMIFLLLTGCSNLLKRSKDDNNDTTMIKQDDSKYSEEDFSGAEEEAKKMIKERTFKEPEIKETIYIEESDIYDIYLIDVRNNEYKISVKMDSRDEKGYFNDITIEEYIEK